MSYDEINDDLATSKRPFRVVACLAVFGRGPLLEQTIKRLYKKNGVYKVICAGRGEDDKRVCEQAGAVWVDHRNTPLGAKWNSSFIKAKEFDPDACLFVGSSDWLSDNWIKTVEPYLKDFDMIGVHGCHFLHLAEEPLLCYWPGYTNGRAGESIGIGRVIGRRLLDKMHFSPFNERLDNSLDHSMQQTCSKHAGKIHLLEDEKLVAVSLSTNAWENKHRFFDHYSGRLPSKKIFEVDKWITNNFPEANIVCESLKGMSPSL